jgi:GH24 family phage-related lysozyme (muramidase)
MITVRQIPQIAIEFIKREEACVLHIYLDVAGKKTIGVGHLLLPNEETIFKDGITESQADDLLRKDLLRTATAIMRLVRVPLTDNQYAALLSFVFNIGTGGFQASTARSRLNRSEYSRVPEAMLSWIYAGGKINKGLMGRRAREAKLFILGENNEKS